MVSEKELLLRAPEDLERARAAARAACARAGLAAREAAHFTLAVGKLAEHLVVAAGRVGVLRVTAIFSEGRSGVQAEAVVRCQDWAVDVPKVEDLVDELDAGFTSDGAIRVWARKWRRNARRPLSQSVQSGLRHTGAQ